MVGSFDGRMPTRGVEQAIVALKKGAHLLKCGKRGKPKFCPFRLSSVFSDAIEAFRVSYRKMNPFCVPFATTNMGSAILAVDLGWMGPNYSLSTVCATSNFCILNAANHIIRGETDAMACGGSDAPLIPIGLEGFVACRALSQRNSDPTKASRPWDVDRDGFVTGEGADVLLLEELEHAKVLEEQN